MVLRSDSASWSSSSSIGMARERRVPKVLIASSGACRSPYTSRFACSCNRSRAGRYSSAATPAATIESTRRLRSSSVGVRPRPTTTTR